MSLVEQPSESVWGQLRRATLTVVGLGYVLVAAKALVDIVLLEAGLPPLLPAVLALIGAVLALPRLQPAFLRAPVGFFSGVMGVVALVIAAIVTLGLAFRIDPALAGYVKQLGLAAIVLSVTALPVLTYLDVMRDGGARIARSQAERERREAIRAQARPRDSVMLRLATALGAALLVPLALGGLALAAYYAGLGPLTQAEVLARVDVPLPPELSVNLPIVIAAVALVLLFVPLGTTVLRRPRTIRHFLVRTIVLLGCLVPLLWAAVPLAGAPMPAPFDALYPVHREVALALLLVSTVIAGFATSRGPSWDEMRRILEREAREREIRERQGGAPTVDDFAITPATMDELERRRTRRDDFAGRAFQGLLISMGLLYAAKGWISGWIVADGLGWVADPNAYRAHLAMVALAPFAAITLASRRMTPRIVRMPQRWFHIPAAFLWIVSMAALAERPAMIAAELSGIAPQVEAATDMLSFVAGVMFVLLLLGVVGAVATAPALPVRVAPTGPAEVATRASDDPADDTASAAQAPKAARVPGRRRKVLQGLSVRLIGLMTLAQAALVLWFVQSGRELLDVAVRLDHVVTGLGLIVGASFLTARTSPGFLYRPTRIVHVFAIAAWACVPALLVLLGAALTLGVSLQAPGTVVEQLRGTLLALADLPAWRITAMIALGSGAMLLLTTIALIWTPLTATERTAREADRPLPSIGLIMKLYMAADWVVLRLLGAGLIGTAWMIYDSQTRGAELTSARLTHGYDPLYATLFYGGLGAMLLVPFLLPRALVVPRNLLGGVLKAALLAGVCVALLTPAQVAVTYLTPPAYHDALEVAILPLLKATAGIAITAALLISFFRQLNAIPHVNYRGETIQSLSQNDLRKIRKQRM